MENWKNQSWVQQLQSAYSSMQQLIDAGLVKQGEQQALSLIEQQYRIRIPQYYAALIGAEENCPIRLQALPNFLEDDINLEQFWPQWAREWCLQAYGRPYPWIADAIGDVAKQGAPRLTHRYRNRVLLHWTSSCGLYCRFCFRKSHLNTKEKALYEGSFDAAFQYISHHPEIREVIFTGGDPLTSSDFSLSQAFQKLASIPHIQHVRVHSKLPTTLPDRLTHELAALLRQQPFFTTLTLHCNHPKELTSHTQKRLLFFARKGIRLLNQSVILRAVNDSPTTLSTLFQQLYECGVTPYYLHYPDWTPGTFHFRPSIERAMNCMEAIQSCLSGPALPRLVLDLPGGLGKIPLLQKKNFCVEKRQQGHLRGQLYQFPLSHGGTVFYPDLYFQ